METQVSGIRGYYETIGKFVELAQEEVEEKIFPSWAAPSWVAQDEAWTSFGDAPDFANSRLPEAQPFFFTLAQVSRRDTVRLNTG